jgi:hypothetical protein
MKKLKEVFNMTQKKCVLKLVIRTDLKRESVIHIQTAVQLIYGNLSYLYKR